MAPFRVPPPLRAGTVLKLLGASSANLWLMSDGHAMLRSFTLSVDPFIMGCKFQTSILSTPGHRL